LSLTIFIAVPKRGRL